MPFHGLLFPKPSWEPANPWQAGSREHSGIVCSRTCAYRFLSPFPNFWLKYPRLFEEFYRIIAFKLMRTESRNVLFAYHFEQELLCHISLNHFLSPRSGSGTKCVIHNYENLAKYFLCFYYLIASHFSLPNLTSLRPDAS